MPDPGRAIAQTEQKVLDAGLFEEFAEERDRVRAMASMAHPEQRKHLGPNAPTGYGVVCVREFLLLEGADPRKPVFDAGRFLYS